MSQMQAKQDRFKPFPAPRNPMERRSMGGREERKPAMLDRAMQVVVLSVLIAGAMALANSAAAGEIVRTGNIWKETLTESHPLAAGGRFAVRNANGEIRVESWDQPQVQIVAHKKMELEKGWIQRLFGGHVDDDHGLGKFEALRVEIHAAAGEVRVETEYPKWTNGINYRVDYEIMVPRQITANARTSNGSIHVLGVDGQVEVASSNGKILVQDVTGSVDAESSNGSITCETLSGGVNARTSNGGIKIRVPGELKPSSEIRCRTSNGSIEVALASGNNFEFTAETSNGAIRSQFPILIDELDTRRYINATVGDGGPQVFLRTSNGSISLQKI